MGNQLGITIAELAVGQVWKMADGSQRRIDRLVQVAADSMVEVTSMVPGNLYRIFWTLTERMQGKKRFGNCRHDHFLEQVDVRMLDIEAKWQ